MRNHAPDLRILLLSCPHAPTFNRREVCKTEILFIIKDFGIPIKISGMPKQFHDVKGWGGELSGSLPLLAGFRSGGGAGPQKS